MSKLHTRRLTLETLEARTLLSADAVLDWNAMMLQANAVDHGLAAPDQGGPGRTARAFAIVQAAVYDALNAIEGDYTPYLAGVNAPRSASRDAAVAQAAHDTLAALYPQQRTTFDRALQESLVGIPPTPRRQGVTVGRACAAEMLAWRTADGSQLPDLPYVPSGQPGAHRPDPLHPNQGYLGVGWDRVVPFTMPDVDLFEVPRVPALTSREYTEAYNEVRTYGAENSRVRTPEQTQIGIYWGYDGSPGLGTPPRLYNQIVRTVAHQQGNSMMENARLLALVNLAMADAGIASWHTKWTDDFWRPIVGIREGDHDGNSRTRGDRNWRPLGAPCSNSCGAGTNFTPPFPAYTSGHATFGAAMFRTLAHFYGTDEIPFTFVSDEYNGVTRDQSGNVRPRLPRSFTSLSQAAEENGQSRIYLGIHWSFDKTWGIEQGNQIADFVFANYLLPRTAGPSDGHERNPPDAVESLQPSVQRSPLLPPVLAVAQNFTATGSRELVPPVNLAVTTTTAEFPAATATEQPVAEVQTVFTLALWEPDPFGRESGTVPI